MKVLYKLTSSRLKLAFGGWKHTDTKGLTVLPDEPNELITRFVAQGLTYGMLQFGFTSMELGSPFKSINLVFTFPELSLQPVTFHWYDMQPDGQLYYATSADTGAMELWDRIAGYPGEPLGFNIEVVKS